MLTAMNQGNDGSMCTVHASSADGALQKLALYASLSAERLAVEVANLLLASAVDLVAFVAYDRGTGRRSVAEDPSGRRRRWRPHRDRARVPATRSASRVS